MYYVFNSEQVIHLKWYQTDAFSVVMVIVAITITVWSWGSMAAQAWALVGAGLYTAAAILVIGVLLEYLAIYLTFKLFVRVFGVKMVFVIAIVAALVGVSGAIDAGGVAGAPWAGDLLTISSGLTTAVGNKLKSDMNDLIGEAKSLLDEEKADTEILKTAQQLLDNNIHLDPFVIFGESSQDFYNRTIHSGNIGVIGLDAISSYVDIALTLPKLSNTVEGFNYDH